MVWSAIVWSNNPVPTMPIGMPSEPMNSLTGWPLAGSRREMSGSSWPARANVTVPCSTSMTA